jgi:membrane peptidoglycan carboxypeptidase
MGYEISITPIQTACAVAALVNGGKYLQPRLVKEIRTADGDVIERHQPAVLREVIRPSTSAAMRDLMEDIVEAGTGKKAQVPGYLVGGKTGTTVKSHIKSHKEYISSFCGVAPLDDPRVVIYVYVDAPKKARYGGTVAAPAFSRIARVSMLHLGIPPNQPVEEDGPADPALMAMGPDAPAPTPIPEGAMPELRGMSLAELRRGLPEVVAAVRIDGTGLVADQQPAPGTPLTPETRIYVTLTPDGRMPDSAIAAAAQEPQQP